MTRRVSLLMLAAVVIMAACSSVSPEINPDPSERPEPTIATQPTLVKPAAVYTPTPTPEIDAPTWFDEAVLYEVFVRSFYDSDGDGVGDLKGITQKLDYMNELGVSAIWLMPIHPSPSYHGYDVTDYQAINPDYGTVADMAELVQEAHGRGMRVVMDLVINHMADDHPIFQDAYANPESDYADWFLWLNDAHTSYSAFGGFRDMPELNHDNPEVLAFVMDVVRFWMDLDGDGDFTDGVDGFRCDVAKDVPLATWQALKLEMRSLNPDSLLLGEVWERNAQTMIQWYDQAFDALFDFPLYHTVASHHDENLDSVLAGVTEPLMLNAIIIGEEKLFPAGYQIVRFASNHDTNRVMSEVDVDWNRARLAATLYLTLPGTPMIYYGEEIGMMGSKGSGAPYWDEYRREPMDWYAAEEGPGMPTWFRPGNRFNSAADSISVEEQADSPSSLLNHYRALTALRTANPALQSGEFAKVTVSETDGVYAYLRHKPPGDGIQEAWFLILLNFHQETQSPSLRLDLAYPGPFQAVDALTGKEWPDVPAGEPYQVDLAPASGTILRLDLR